MINGHVGLMKVGLPSTEAPAVVKSKTQWNHVGQWRLGTPQYLRQDVFFKCKGKIMADYSTFFKHTGILSIKTFAYQQIKASIFSPNIKFNIKAIGSIALPYTTQFFQSGIIRQKQNIAIGCKGLLGAGTSFIHTVSAICRANSSKTMSITGVIKQSGKYYAQSTGFLLANYSSIVKSTGVLQQITKGYHNVKGILGYGVNTTMQIQGVIQQAGTVIHGCIGGLANTAGHIFITITGKINIAAFVSSVPKRIQEFYTNKRWFN